MSANMRLHLWESLGQVQRIWAKLKAKGKIIRHEGNKMVLGKL